MEKSTDTDSTKKSIPVTYLEAATSSDETVPRPRTKLLVEADDFIDDVLANLALKRFIFIAK